MCMETMTPMDFLDFRDLLVPASGFQSKQFREIEVKLGLKTNERKGVDREYFLGRLNEADKKHVIDAEKDMSLIDAVDSWLKRLPFTSVDGFEFWKEYKAAVYEMIEDDENIVQNNPLLTKEQIEANLANLKLSKANFESLFDLDLHNEIVESGKRRLSHKATLVCIVTEMKQSCLSHSNLTSMNIDENFRDGA